MIALLKIMPESTERKVLGTNTTIDDVIHEKAWGEVNYWTQELLAKVLPGLAQSPALEPVLKTKQDIEITTQEVKDLPNAQKRAICKEICGP